MINFQIIFCVMCPDGIAEFLLDCGHFVCSKCVVATVLEGKPCPKDNKVSEGWLKLKKR